MKYLLGLTLFFSINITVLHAQDDPSPSEFMQAYLGYIKGKAPDIKAVVSSELKVNFETDKGEKIKIDLSGGYKNYKELPEARDKIVSTYGDSIIYELYKKNFCEGHVFPKIVDSTYINQVTEIVEQQNQTFPFYYDVLNEEIYIVYAAVSGPIEHYLSNQDISDLGLELGQIKDFATKNLRKCESIHPFEPIKNNQGFYTLRSGRVKGKAAIFLIDSFWNEWNMEEFPIKGNIVIYVSSDGHVIITGSEDRNLIKEIKTKMNMEIGFLRDGNKWVIYK